MRTGRFPPIRLAFALAGVVLAIAVFGLVVVFGQGGRLGAPQTSPTPAMDSATPVIVTRSGDVTVTETANGQTITIAQGHTVTMTLGSTYWMFTGSSNPAVLQQDGPPAYVSSTKCVPGGGCGTATMRFKAIAPGTAGVSASRTSCGEALACGPDQATFQITVVVTA